jgi:hypothetical protein
VRRYPINTIKKIQELRSSGKTYREINLITHLKISKSTLSGWCRQIILSKEQKERISDINLTNLKKGRSLAFRNNQLKRKEYFKFINIINTPISKGIYDKKVAKIALAMLCLGEARKSHNKSNQSFNLGNSDPRIILIFFKLLKYCFNFDINKIRCTVQCRADQDTGVLEKYWIDITGIPKRLFYKARIDPRTKGKPTLKKEYKGVLRIDYFDRKVQHDLESLANLIYNQTNKMGR